MPHNFVTVALRPVPGDSPNMYQCDDAFYVTTGRAAERRREA